MNSQVRFKRVVTGYRCLEGNCCNTGVWYVETESEFFHWCPKHAVSHMRDTRFWKKRLAVAYADQAQYARGEAHPSKKR